MTTFESISTFFDGIPGFDTIQLVSLLHDLPVPDHVYVPGLSMSEVVEVR